MGRGLCQNDIKAVNAFFGTTSAQCACGTSGLKRQDGYKKIVDFRIRQRTLKQDRNLKNKALQRIRADFGVPATKFFRNIVCAHVSFGLA